MARLWLALLYLMTCSNIKDVFEVLIMLLKVYVRIKNKKTLDVYFISKTWNKKIEISIFTHRLFALYVLLKANFALFMLLKAKFSFKG